MKGDKGGWILLHRSIMDNAFFKDSECVHLWLTLLLMANHEAKEFLFNKQLVKVERGQFISGEHALSTNIGFGRFKVRRILKMLENAQQITRQTTTKYSLFTIVNYDKYQRPTHQTAQQANNKQTTNKQQAHTNKELLNNYKELKEEPLARKRAGVSKTTTPKPPKGEVTFNALGGEIIKAFTAVDPKNKNHYGNKTQRKACDFLIAEYGLKNVLDVIAVLPQLNAKKLYVGQVTTPYELQEKWVKLANAIKSECDDNKAKVAF